MKHIVIAVAALFASIGLFAKELPEVYVVPQPTSMAVVKGLHECKGETVGIDKKLGKEEYVLDTRGSRIRIVAGSEAGLFYAEQTLRQIRAQYPEGKIPGVLIQDKPFFAYRGAMLDCSRHFFSVDEVKKYIDILATHKINVFHWHLTDDQGWRIEIKKYPLLTQISSNRKETRVGHSRKDPEKYDGIPYGGFYTQDELRDVVKYASDRQITIIPEVEMPGHSIAVLAAYPQFGCTGGPYEVWTNWGINPDILCAGKPQVMQFLFDVLDEVCDIFPSEFIHIGGDEAPRDRWKVCPDCQKMMKEKGYKREAELQSMIISEVEQHLAAKGRKIIGWDEILDGGVEKTATVMSWRGPQGGQKAAKLGNNAIMVPHPFLYFDKFQTVDPKANGEPLAISGPLSLSKVFAYNPFADISPENQKYIVGVQCNIWCEYIATFDHVQKMLLPRLAALSEIAWNGNNRTNYADFRDRCRKSLVPLYKQWGYLYSDYDLREHPANPDYVAK